MMKLEVTFQNEETTEAKVIKAGKETRQQREVEVDNRKCLSIPKSWIKLNNRHIDL